MFRSRTNVSQIMGEFKIEDHLFRYSVFVAKLYNYCKSLGFEPGKIMPSRAFCSDESQGYPIILISKHFGTFPFNHGLVGGVVATDRHGPHAEHGKDMLIIQASHVGYDPESKKFGVYRRICTEHDENSSSCGKIDSVLAWYESEYRFAKNNIFVEKRNNDYFLIIDNYFTNEERTEGLFLNMDLLVSDRSPVESYSTSKCFRASAEVQAMYEWIDNRKNIGKNLIPEFFYYKRNVISDIESQGHLESNLLPVMPWIVTAAAPLLAAAQINTQIEFDRTFRTIVKEKGYQGKRVLFISGIHIDISPSEDQLFPLTKFVPWAAFIQDTDGSQRTLEQNELYEQLNAQSSENPDQIDMEAAIHVMEDAQEVKVI
ncbi:MAG: hypothetical protein OQL06_11010 [Gammaproteobacteria bacterium]|nr:hypothetical protein [Gammaproteobacteria bacterium]